MKLKNQLLKFTNLNNDVINIVINYTELGLWEYKSTFEMSYSHVLLLWDEFVDENSKFGNEQFSNIKAWKYTRAENWNREYGLTYDIFDSLILTFTYSNTLRCKIIVHPEKYVKVKEWLSKGGLLNQ